MERKLYPCKKCGKEVPIRSKGLCPVCRNKQRQKEGDLPVYKKSIKKSTEKRNKQRKKERGCLPEFFERHVAILSRVPVSDESGQIIPFPDSSNIAHILPKRKVGGFPSLQCHMENVVYLTTQEHNRFDQLLDERNYSKLEEEFPKTWKKVRKVLPKLLSLCTERNKLYFSLKEYLENEK